MKYIRYFDHTKGMFLCRYVQCNNKEEIAEIMLELISDCVDYHLPITTGPVVQLKCP